MRLRRSLALAALLLVAAPASAFGWNNQLARTPPMGWNQWNHFKCSVDERLVLDSADALVYSGMRGAGYNYVNIDDCWMAPQRAADGSLVADPARFPHGMPWLAAQIHQRGLKFGLYISAGLETCARFPGSFGHLQQDISQLASWGVDYLKVDWCYQAPGSQPRQTFGHIRDLIAATHRPIVFSVSDGFDPSWSWGPRTANLWRIGRDVDDSWDEVTQALDIIGPLGRYAGPGAWNDPDMLQVGNPGLNLFESQAQMSLWSIVAAPLIAGNDVRSMSVTTRRLLINREVIAVDQDRNGRPGWRWRSSHGHEIWLRHLADGTEAILLLNRNLKATTMKVNLRSLPGLRGGGKYRVRDLWGHRSFNSAAWLATGVPPHGVGMFRVHRR